jgi:hypothetical protein
MLPQSKCPRKTFRYSVGSQAEDKAIRGRNLSADLVAGMAGQSICPKKHSGWKALNPGVWEGPILRFVLVPLASNLSANVVCAQDETFRHFRSPVLHSTS